jgi:hypothetical protein
MRYHGHGIGSRVQRRSTGGRALGVIDMTVYRPILRKIPLEELSSFAGNLATCLGAGIGVRDAADLSIRCSFAVIRLVIVRRSS